MKVWTSAIDPATIPSDVLHAEVARRRAAKRVTHGGPARTCECGSCSKCLMRAYQNRRRAALRAGGAPAG